MSDHGWPDGRNIEHRFAYADGDMTRLDALDRGLIEQGRGEGRRLALEIGRGDGQDERVRVVFVGAKVDRVVTRNTARAIGLALPLTPLLRADGMLE